jgi:uncharacterized delta-60 repeat protein
MKKSIPAFCFALVAFLLFALPVGAVLQSRPGSLDRAFADGGMALQGFGLEPGGGGASDVALQPDGKAVVLIPARGFSLAYSLARYLPDGSLDPSFGDGGYAVGDFGAFRSEAVELALQPDGKVLVAGAAWDGPSRFAVARHLPDGRPDPGFGDAGAALYEGSPPFESGAPNAMVLQPDGKVVLAGTVPWNPKTQIELLRLNGNGTIDHSFGGDGFVSVPVSDAYVGISARALVVHEGKLTVAVGSAKGVLLARLQPDGSLDGSFGQDGIATTPLVERAHELTIQPDGRILLLAEWAVARLLEDGSEDASFGEGGRTPLPERVRGSALALLPDGHTLIAGRLREETSETSRDFALARLSPDGHLDPAFGDGAGYVTTDVGLHRHDEALDLVPLPDGGALLVGESTPEGGSWLSAEAALARYASDGGLDPSFGGGAFQAQPQRASRDAVLDLVVDRQGRVTATGRGGGEIVLSRLLANGRPDPSFGSGGTVTVPTQVEAQGEAILRYPDGRLLVGTGSQAGGGMLRYLPDGRSDPGFGAGGAVSTPFLDHVFDLVRAKDGKILAVGLTYEPCELRLARFGTGGAPDPSFGDGAGFVRVTWMGGPCTGHSADLAQARDGRIIVAGQGNHGFVNAYAQDGERIKEFGHLPNGRSSRKLPRQVRAVVLQRDGRIIVAGASHRAFAVVRLRSDGSADPSFGRRGQVMRTPILYGATIAAVRVEPSGKILAAGTAEPCSSFYGCPPSLAVARYDARGVLDRSFGRGGIRLQRVELASGLNALALGKRTAVLGGWAVASGDDSQFLIARVRR